MARTIGAILLTGCIGDDVLLIRKLLTGQHQEAGNVVKCELFTFATLAILA
jgi:hypothetical protein